MINFNLALIKRTFTWEAKRTHTCRRFENGVKTSSVHMTFHFGCISKRLNILMDMCRHFISRIVSVKFLSKWPIWNPYPLSFKRTRALKAISNEYALTHFATGNFCSQENLMPVWNFIPVKMNDMKSIPVWVSFCLNSFKHK